MTTKHHLGAADYAVILASLIVSSLIGLGFRFTGGKQRTTDEYLLAGKNSYILPVVMSTTVTMISGITLMGMPVENYRFGTQLTIMGFFSMVGMVLASRIFIPVYFQCGVSSIYEYLEMRFGKCTRYTIAIIFIVQMVLYMSVVLYAPVLALSAVTEFSVKMTIIVCGSVCTLYCFLGGLKAVMWTDVFQCILMFLCLIVMSILGIYEVGGIDEIYRRSNEGNRFHFFDMSFDLTKRYTFWNAMFRGLNFGIGFYGSSQAEVQRLLSVNEYKKARSALQWSAIPVGILIIFSCLFGLVMYSVFFLCDPVLMQEETGITKYDQMVPYFLITRLKSIPGMTGLCIAGIFSGSLSSISSALNSLATVSVVDFVLPIFGTRLSDSKMVFIAKCFSLLFGILCILLTLNLESARSIVQICITFVSMVEGPVLGIFFIGVMTRKVSDKCATAGLIIGLVLMGWIGFGSIFSGFVSPSLPLETSGCSHPLNGTSNVFLNRSINLSPIERTDKDVFVLYKLAFCWFGTIGSLLTICAAFIISFVKDRNKDIISSKSKCLSPILQHWKKSESDTSVNNAVKNIEENGRNTPQ